MVASNITPENAATFFSERRRHRNSQRNFVNEENDPVSQFLLPLELEQLLSKEHLESMETLLKMSQWRIQVLGRLETFVDNKGIQHALFTHREIERRLNAFHLTLNSIFRPDYFVAVIEDSHQTLLGDLTSKASNLISSLKNFIPENQESGNMLGYSKYHMAVVFLRNDFEVYEKIMKIDNIMSRLLEGEDNGGTNVSPGFEYGGNLLRKYFGESWSHHTRALLCAMKSFRRQIHYYFMEAVTKTGLGHAMMKRFQLACARPYIDSLPVSPNIKTGNTRKDDGVESGDTRSPDSICTCTTCMDSPESLSPMPESMSLDEYSPVSQAFPLVLPRFERDFPPSSQLLLPDRSGAQSTSSIQTYDSRRNYTIPTRRKIAFREDTSWIGAGKF